jgi:GT2 family glycosyltransferase
MVELRPQSGVSVIVPTYGRPDQLDRCLRSVRRQHWLNFLEIVVVDDGTPTAEVRLVAESHDATYLRSGARLGSGHAKNLGLQVAAGELVLFLDSDAELVSDRALECLVRVLHTADRAGSVGGEGIFDAESRVRYICGRRVDSVTGRSHTDFAPVIKDLAVEQLVQCDYVPTSNCLVARELALRINGFDDAYRSVGEDKDFGFRLKLLGYHSYVSPEGVVRHDFDPRGRDADGLSRLYRTQIRFCWRYNGLIRTVPTFVQAVWPKPTEESLPSDPLIDELSRRYVQNVLHVDPAQPCSRFHSLFRFAMAWVWNVTHRRGVHSWGSVRVSLDQGPDLGEGNGQRREVDFDRHADPADDTRR